MTRDILVIILTIIITIGWVRTSRSKSSNKYILLFGTCFVITVILYITEILTFAIIPFVGSILFFIFALLSEHKAKKVTQSGRLFTVSVLNDTSQTLTVYFNHDLLGDVNPHGQIDYDNANWDTGQYRIKAETIDGNAIYSKSLSRDEMERIANMVYRVTIKPAS